MPEWLILTVSDGYVHFLHCYANICKTITNIELPQSQYDLLEEAPKVCNFFGQPYTVDILSKKFHIMSIRKNLPSNSDSS